MSTCLKSTLIRTNHLIILSKNLRILLILRRGIAAPLLITQVTACGTLLYLSVAAKRMVRLILVWRHCDAIGLVVFLCSWCSGLWRGMALFISRWRYGKLDRKRIKYDQKRSGLNKHGRKNLKTVIGATKRLFNYRKDNLFR